MISQGAKRSGCDPSHERSAQGYHRMARETIRYKSTSGGRKLQGMLYCTNCTGMRYRTIRKHNAIVYSEGDVIFGVQAGSR